MHQKIIWKYFSPAIILHFPIHWRKGFHHFLISWKLKNKFNGIVNSGLIEHGGQSRIEILDYIVIFVISIIYLSLDGVAMLHIVIFSLKHYLKLIWLKKLNLLSIIFLLMKNKIFQMFFLNYATRLLNIKFMLQGIYFKIFSKIISVKKLRMSIMCLTNVIEQLLEYWCSPMLLEWDCLKKINLIG